MAEVLFISKAVESPWNDSSKNLVRDISTSLKKHQAVVMRRKGSTELLSGTIRSDVYLSASRFSPAIHENSRVLVRLLRSKEKLFHFFFAPNTRSASVGRSVLRLKKVPSIHTICSVPADNADFKKVLFADIQVALSKRTKQLLLSKGVPAEKIRCIGPALRVPQIEPQHNRQSLRNMFNLPADVPIILYPGDLEFSQGAITTLTAIAGLYKEVFLVFACRAKTAMAREAEQVLRQKIKSFGLENRVQMIGEISNIHHLLAAVDLVVLPSETLYAKMDYPLVILEAMALKRPVIVSRGTPAEELIEGGAKIIEPDIDDLREAIKTLLKDQDLCAKLGEKGHQWVSSHFAQERIAEQYEALYDELL